MNRRSLFKLGAGAAVAGPTIGTQAVKDFVGGPFDVSAAQFIPETGQGYDTNALNPVKEFDIVGEIADIRDRLSGRKPLFGEDDATDELYYHGNDVSDANVEALRSMSAVGRQLLRRSLHRKRVEAGRRFDLTRRLARLLKMGT